MESELYHHGIFGQRWGIRRYQNKDGTLTDAGRKRYEKMLKKMDPEDRKISITKTKDPEIVYMHRNEFSKEELEFIRQRINLETNIRKLSEAQKEKALNNLKRSVEWERTIDDFAKTTGNLIVDGENLINILSKTFNKS